MLFASERFFEALAQHDTCLGLDGGIGERFSPQRGSSSSSATFRLPLRIFRVRETPNRTGGTTRLRNGPASIPVGMSNMILVAELARIQSDARVQRKSKVKGFLPGCSLGPLYGPSNPSSRRSFSGERLQCADLFRRPRAPFSIWASHYFSFESEQTQKKRNFRIISSVAPHVRAERVAFDVQFILIQFTAKLIAGLRVCRLIKNTYPQQLRQSTAPPDSDNNVPLPCLPLCHGRRGATLGRRTRATTWCAAYKVIDRRPEIPPLAVVS